MNLFSSTYILKKLTAAYYDARKHKRNTVNALKFELNLEENIYALYQEIVEYRYSISPSICFVVNKPVKREIFAADFRDRVVHHYVINQLNTIFDNQMIYDCYSCRKGKGVEFAVMRAKRFMNAASQNFTAEAYVMKLDVQGFFMSIHRPTLWRQVERIVESKYHGNDKPVLLYLLQTIILHSPVQNCIVKGKRSDWDDLPRSKSLFFAAPDCGLPIGNLTSQVFANIYLSPLDRFIKERLHVRYYGRYVDDMLFYHADKVELNRIRAEVAAFLLEMGMWLHPKKSYLQDVLKGVPFLGAMVMPYRLYVGNRGAGNFCDFVRRMQRYRCAESMLCFYEEDRKLVEASVSSYVGLWSHRKGFHVMHRLTDKLPLRLFEWAG